MADGPRRSRERNSETEPASFPAAYPGVLRHQPRGEPQISRDIFAILPGDPISWRPSSDVMGGRTGTGRRPAACSTLLPYQSSLGPFVVLRRDHFKHQPSARVSRFFAFSPFRRAFRNACRAEHGLIFSGTALLTTALPLGFGQLPSHVRLPWAENSRVARAAEQAQSWHPNAPV
jgi:hypothetical protein